MESLGVIEPDFWRGRRVFLTGHTGFKGAWLSLWLADLGTDLTGYALPPPNDPSLFDLADARQGMTSVEGDIRDLPKLEAALQKAQPELIIHMAAQSLVRESYADPLGTYVTNVIGTAHLLDAARRCPSVRGVLAVTSDKCYENHEGPQPYREPDALGGHDPYSSSKACAEIVVSAYRRSFLAERNIAVATARAGNVIGGGDWAQDRLAPDAMRAFLAGETLEIRNPGAIRPWQHVLDPLRGYLLLCQQLLGDKAASFAESWNFGPPRENEQTVAQIVAMLKKLWGPQAASREIRDDKQPHEARYLRLDGTKAHEHLKWRPRYGLEEALKLTVDWYKACQAKRDLRELTLRQIRDMQHA